MSNPSRKPQMPGLLTLVDDPWGIGWRTANAIRRQSLKRSWRWLRAWLQNDHLKRPIFVFGVPRSGTTSVFHLLRSLPTLGSLPGEGHDVWRLLHHPRFSDWRSDGLGPGQVRWGERRLIHARFRVDISCLRLVEKTPESSLRIPYLLDLFPDAHFVAVHRNPVAVVRSLIRCWRHPEGRFRSYYVPEKLAIPGYPHRRLWCFALVDGWRGLRTSPVPEIAFEQWRQCGEGIVEGRRRVAAQQWTEVWLEDLLANPQRVLSDLDDELGLQAGGGWLEAAQDLLARPLNVSEPIAEEATSLDIENELRPLLSQMLPLARQLGYSVDVETGEAARLQ